MKFYIGRPGDVGGGAIEVPLVFAIPYQFGSTRIHLVF